MSIKSDRWIRRMAASTGMIEPFSPDQVRVANGHKIVSYGTSSYGYDVRCADDFKIFTNINSTIVDPKAFDEKSFVDFKGPVCIIPPNSFALASTVEYFRIPRSVLTVCLGKCVAGDTRVVDADTGAYLPITEMRWGKSTLSWNGRKLERSNVSAFIPQGRREVFALRTRAGLEIRATSNHPFLTPVKWVPLGELQLGDRIAVARDIPVFGKTPIPAWEVSQLGRMIAAGLGTQGEGVPQAIFMAPEASTRLFLQALFSAEGSIDHGKNGVFVEYHSSSRRLIEDVHHLLLRFGIFSSIRQQTTQPGATVCKIQIAEEDQIRHFIERVGFVAGSAKQRLLEEQLLERCVLPSSVAAPAGGYSLRTSGHDATASVSGPLWDTVERVVSVGVEEVFDITVPGLHNFVANDLIVHNSTYARCFSGDTRVALTDGSAPSLEEMACGHERGDTFTGFSVDARGRIVARDLEAPRYIGRDTLLEIELDNGARIRATPDHKFMRRDGIMIEAHRLRPADALMPLYRDASADTQILYQPLLGAGTRSPAAGLPAYRNHAVRSIRSISGDHDVFCLTVPGTANFALEAGVFVHNCGIIVNVTPLEPEWEGHVTLEFSNTTPLPAKIYANEGVAQMLFFESDEVCETSYADRGGKYQGQRGVTLPKT